MVILTVIHSRVSLTCAACGFDKNRKLHAAPLRNLSRRYAAARESRRETELLAIGRSLYDWLDGDERWLETLRDQSPAPFMFEARSPTLQPDEDAWTVLNAPWEVMADANGFLARDETLCYAPARRLGLPTAAPALDKYRLGIAFMAAAPHGARDLDFEAEEEAILQAASGDLDLFVEESGEADELGKRLRDIEAQPPVLHLSCHGHDAWTGRDGRETARPVLMLESVTGEEQAVGAGRLNEALGNYQPRLLFLSACLSASARSSDSQSPDKRDEAAESGHRRSVADSLATGLIRAGMPDVLGWDGSVADVAATAFAKSFYEALGRRVSTPVAAGNARRKLLRESEAADGGKTDHAVWRDWHLSRLWLGSHGGGAIVGGGLKRSLLPANHGTKKLLAVKKGENLEVADPAMFVGRRREVQRALRCLRDGESSGVLLHGMGRLGKSSLAARISDRLADRMRLAVVFGEYDALSVVMALHEALMDAPAARTILDRGRAALQKDPTAFETTLIKLLSGPCQQTPVLLLIDDLERLLESDRAGRHRVRLQERPVLAALLRAFDPTLTESRLLITSRFRFKLVEDDQDLADRLTAIELSEFSATAQRKLALRQIKATQAKAASALDPAALVERTALLEQSQALARGNPGLQDLLGVGFVLRKAVPLEQAAATLNEMAAYLERGALPATEKVREFLQGLALDKLLDLAGEGGRALLRATTLLALPSPEAVIEALAAAVGSGPERLRDLGLLTPGDDPVIAGGVGWSVNGLAASRLPALSEAEREVMAQAALPSLLDAWGGVEDRLQRPAAADIELAKTAVAAGNPDVAAATAPYAVRALLNQHPGAALALGQAVVDLLEASGVDAPLTVLAQTAEAASATGDGSLADALLAKGAYRVDELQATSAENLRPLSNYLFRLGNRQMQAGKLDDAEITFKRLHDVELRRENEHQAAVARGSLADILRARGQLDEALCIRTEGELPVYTRLGDLRSIAITQGKIADILQARGQLDEALRIRTEEELPVYTRLGDLRSTAVTQGQIADILQARGQLDEALRIRAEEQLPVFTRLGDVRELAVAQGNIADILQARGQLDEALRIRTEEQLPVFTRLGDLRSIAVTRGKIADILQARGQLDEALRIHTEEQVPVFTRLGDLRSIAVTRGKIADILEARGQLDEALRIRTEEQLPVFTRLGDLRSIAVTQGKIADILQARGQLDEALRIRTEEQLPVFTRLGDVRELAVTQGKIADILQARGQLDEALRIHTEETLPVYTRLGDLRSIAVTQGQIADILQARGQLDEAMRIRTEEQLPVFTRLGDVRELAVTQGKIADILQARGQLDEARRLQAEMLEANRKLQDIDGVAATLWALASLDLAQDAPADAIGRLQEAWPLLQRLGRADGLAVVGQFYGKLLIAVGQKADARDVLRASARAFRTLGRDDEAAEVETSLQSIPDRR